MEFYTNPQNFSTDETLQKTTLRLPPIRYSKSNFDLSLSDGELSGLYSKDSQDLKPWTFSNSKIKLSAKPVATMAKKTSNKPLEIKRNVSVNIERRNPPPPRKPKPIPRLSSVNRIKLDDSINNDEDSFDLSIDKGRPRAQTDLVPRIQADIVEAIKTQDRKFPLIIEARRKLGSESRNGLEKNTYLERHPMSLNLIKQISKSRQLKVDKTFDDGKLLESSFIENKHNKSFDSMDSPRKLPPVDLQGILDEISTKRLVDQIKKESVPQMFIRDERHDDKPKIKSRQKSELVCWKDNERPARKLKNPVKTGVNESLLSYLELVKGQVDHSVIQNGQGIYKKKSYLNDYIDHSGKNKSLLDINHQSEGLNMESSLRAKIEGVLFKRKNSPYLEIKKPVVDNHQNKKKKFTNGCCPWNKRSHDVLI